MRDMHLTGVERRMGRDDLIVSKTDTGGRITYANRTFVAISGFTERELLGRPHNLVRHPHMPRGVFKYLWETIGAGQEVFAYVLNRCKNGDHYWVFAHVTPTFDPAGRIVGYHSNRRAPLESAVAAIKPLYQRLLAAEARHTNPRDACQASLATLHETLQSQKQTYDDFVFSISPIDEPALTGGKR